MSRNGGEAFKYGYTPVSVEVIVAMLATTPTGWSKDQTCRLWWPYLPKTEITKSELV